ncbi:MAG: three-Cys-motif partner protein TcmP [Armatimonadota bacterium]|nr:three-Cys-motif partner protein TcmP [Armatimonadota bacterium]
MPEHRFGGSWTEEKLDRIRQYLPAYTKVFKGPYARRYKTVYLDAFAGTGHRSQSRPKVAGETLFAELAEPDTKEFLKGSAHIALETEPPFDLYLFIEKDTKRSQDLEQLKLKFPDKAAGIQIVKQDANSYLEHWCDSTDWKQWRAVVFLDPYGMQVNWSTLEKLAQTKAVDLWLLFPLGQAVNRLLTKQEPPAKWAEALTRIFGTDEWRKEFYSPKPLGGLFNEENLQSSREVKTADFDKIGQFFVNRLKTIFTEVAPNPLTLYNSKNVPIYLLCFAVASPTGAPIALKIAKHILRK